MLKSPLKMEHHSTRGSSAKCGAVLWFLSIYTHTYIHTWAEDVSAEAAEVHRCKASVPKGLGKRQRRVGKKKGKSREKKN